LARHDLYCRGAGAYADHWAQVRAATVLRALGLVDTVVDFAADLLERYFFRHAGSSDPPGLLPYRSFIPTRVLPVVSAHVECIIDRDGPNPGRRPVRHAVFAERCDVQVISLTDVAQLVFLPCGHCRSSLRCGMAKGTAAS